MTIHLQDRNRDKSFAFQKKKIISFALFISLALFGLTYGAFDRILGGAHLVAVAIFGAENILSKTLISYKTAFSSKDELVASRDKAIEDLKNIKSLLRDRGMLLEENIKLKEVLGRIKKPSSYKLASVLSRPRASLYGSLIVDIGSSDGVKMDDFVFAMDESLVGNVVRVSENSAVVSLFSAPHRKTEASLSSPGVSVDLTGLGAGGFVALLPRGSNVATGTAVVLPGISKKILGYVSRIVLDPREPFQNIFVETPSNFEETDFVLVEI